MPCYVVTEPESIRGIYHSWEECKAKVQGEAGAVFQKVENRGDAQAMLEGTGIVLPPGLHVFTDGNHRGGVGVVVVWMSEEDKALPLSASETATSVWRIFSGKGIVGLENDEAVSTTLARIRNVLSELAGLFIALDQAPFKSQLNIVHDFEGVGAWMEGDWAAIDPIVKCLIDECRFIAVRKDLSLTFQWQRGHSSSWAGRNDLARFNGLADQLATQGSSTLGSPPKEKASMIRKRYSESGSPR